jgi:hypothetical protein
MFQENGNKYETLKVGYVRSTYFDFKITGNIKLFLHGPEYSA